LFRGDHFAIYKKTVIICSWWKYWCIHI